MLIHSVLLNHMKGESSIQKYQFLSNVYEQDRFSLLCTECLSPLSFSRLQAYRMRDWLKWVNVNIILQLGDTTMSEKRLGVLMRIASNMLDKVPQFDDITQIEMLTNLRYNVWKEYYTIRTEDLPFLDISHWVDLCSLYSLCLLHLYEVNNHSVVYSIVNSYFNMLIIWILQR